MRSPSLLLPLALVALVACGSDEPDGPEDTGVIADTGVDDTGADDTGDVDDVDDVDLDTDVADAVEDAEADTDEDTIPELDIEPREDTFVDTGPDYLYALEDLTGFVDPMIGTDGAGNTIPGALVPHGVVRLSPVTNIRTDDVDAYEFGEETIYGFSHTHLEGPGGGRNGYAHVMVTPTIAGGSDVYAHASTFSHENEHAEPGYYRVLLDEGGITAELTASRWVGVHRYGFDAEGPAQIALNLTESRGESTGGWITVTGDDTIEGMAEYNIHPIVRTAVGDGEMTARSRVYFTAQLGTPAAQVQLWKGLNDAELQDEVELSGRRLGALLSFPEGTTTVELRVGLSLIDVEHARENLRAEVEGRSFDEVVAANQDAWNRVLNRVQITADDDVSTRFYTALYHFAFQPADYTEHDGSFYLSADGYDHTIPTQGHAYYTDDWCLWDTYRTSWPLRTFLEPELIDPFVSSLLLWDEVGGWIPRCTWNATGYSRVMTGNNAFPVIADAVVRGFEGFDHAEALSAMVHTASEDDNPFPRGLCGYLGTGTNPEYVENGYVDHACDPHQSASMTMEYAYHDWCVAEVAEVVGNGDVEAEFRARAGYWRNVWDVDAGFPRGRMADGSWVEPFDPTDMSDNNDFVEASAWIFTFFVPHDFEGLIGVLGGEEVLQSRLDTFFGEGYFDPTNQPSFHIPFLYNLSGQPSVTQDRVWGFRDANFPLDNGGLPGNDDAGSTSAWLVLAGLGIYPITPGEPVYQLTTPMVEHAVIHLNQYFAEGETFTIEAPGVSETRRYIQSVTLNDAPLTRTWITHDELIAGGTLRFEVGEAPSDWGAADE